MPLYTEKEYYICPHCKIDGGPHHFKQETRYAYRKHDGKGQLHEYAKPITVTICCNCSKEIDPLRPPSKK